jgi:hypothetical protein
MPFGGGTCVVHRTRSRRPTSARSAISNSTRSASTCCSFRRVIRAGADTLIPNASHRREVPASSPLRTSGARLGHPPRAHATGAAADASPPIRRDYLCWESRSASSNQPLAARNTSSRAGIPSGKSVFRSPSRSMPSRAAAAELPERLAPLVAFCPLRERRFVACADRPATP